MPGIQLSFGAASALAVLVVLISAAAAVFFYRRTVPPVNSARRILLTLLRTCALSLLGLLLLEPVLRLVSVRTQAPGIAVLIDDSRSMQIVDRAGSRPTQLRETLRSGSFDRIAARGELRYFTFGSALREAAPPGNDTLPLDENATNLGAALSSLESRRDQLNLSAAVILTDGSNNLGRNPLYDAEELALPLYPVAIGDSSEQKDVLINRVVANDLVYGGTQAPVDVTVKSSGFNGERVEVTLSGGSRELDRATLVLGEGTREYATRLHFTPEGEGMQKFDVRVSSLQGELTQANNHMSFYAKILKSKLRITIIAGGPSPDLPIVRETLSEDKNLAVAAFTQRSPSGFYEGALTAARLDSSDCVVLLDFPTQASSAATMDLLRREFARRNTAVLFIGGRDLDIERLQSLASFLPFTALPGPSTEEYVSFQPSEAQRASPILTFGMSAALDAWDRLPPIFRTQEAFRARPEATTLGFCRIGNAVLRDPLLLARNVAGQKSLSLLGYGIWRWRLMAQDRPETARLFSLFLSSSIKWLTTPEDKRPVKVVPTRESYAQGEPVEFTGQVRDATAQPVDNAQVRVRATLGHTIAETDLRPIGGGLYEGRIEGLGEGEYTFQATAGLDSVRLGDDRGRLSVGGMNLEFQNTRMDAALLRQLAYQTGGRYIPAGDLTALDSALASQPTLKDRETRAASSFELWNWQYTLACVVLLFAMEWFLRKKSGML